MLAFLKVCAVQGSEWASCSRERPGKWSWSPWPSLCPSASLTQFLPDISTSSPLRQCLMGMYEYNDHLFNYKLCFQRYCNSVRQTHVSKVQLRTEVPGVSVMVLRFRPGPVLPASWLLPSSPLYVLWGGHQKFPFLEAPSTMCPLGLSICHCPFTHSFLQSIIHSIGGKWWGSAIEGTCQPLCPGACNSGVGRKATDMWTSSRMWTVTGEKKGLFFRLFSSALLSLS